jgi:hypothetical protein
MCRLAGRGGQVRKLGLATIVTVFVLVIATAIPSGAVPISVLEYQGTAYLHQGFPVATGTGDFVGVAKGISVDSVTHKLTNCSGGCALTSTNYTYHEPDATCVKNAPLAAIGTANGVLQFHSKKSATSPVLAAPKFSWTRVGVTAIVTLSNPTGVSVAEFTPPSKCHFTTAQITGVSVTG